MVGSGGPMRFIPSLRTVVLAVVLGWMAAAVPVPALAFGPPRTLTAPRTLGAVEGPSSVTDPDFPVDYLGVSWVDGSRPSVRFLVDGDWGPWTRVVEDEIPTTGGRTWSALVPAGDADAYQVRGDNTGVRGFALNTTDGPRSLGWQEPVAQASHIAQPPLLSRAQWGANESLRCKADGTPKFSWTFHPTQKLIVHHTVTANADPDPAATVRAIYEYHVQDRGFIDIAYNFLVDAQGVLYKGRYSGPNGTCLQDTPTGENATGRGVTGAHTGGFNSGTMGIAILGNYVSTPIPEPARLALVEHLAWESERHFLDPLATSTYVNPAGGATKAGPNISGHRDWTATQCPGELLYDALPAIRQEVAARTGPLAPADTEPPRVSRIRAKVPNRRTVVFLWRTGEPATGEVRYWQPGHRRRTSPLDEGLSRRHEIGVRPVKRDTDYRYVVISRDAAGNKAKGRVKRFSTPG